MNHLDKKMSDKNESLKTFDLIQGISKTVKQPYSNEKCYLSNFLIVAFLLLVAAALQILILIYIFVKKQIMKLKTSQSNKDSQASIEQSCEEIHEKIEAFYSNLSNFIQKIEKSGRIHKQYYRFKAVNDMKKIENMIFQLNKCKKAHKPFYKMKNVRRYLVDTFSSSWDISKLLVIHELCDIYERARFDPSDFQEVDYSQFTNLLEKFINMLVTQ